VKNHEQVKQLGQHIKKLREERKISQIELADEADVARSTIQRVEKAEINATIDLLLTLAKALKVKPREFFDFIKK
jgi:transcriptional regulator with XRE-family HTH domain